MRWLGVYCSCLSRVYNFHNLWNAGKKESFLKSSAFMENAISKKKVR